ncbi:MAG: alanine racemase, partial [Leuconostoc sp.]|nr:alanine racemase [Leuconostoc sp.]
MVPGYHRPAAVKVNLGAIRRNLENEMKHLDPGQKMLAVVKANAYGHGAVEVAKVAEEVGAAGFCVAVLDEGLQLRHADIVKPILVLGVVSPKYAPIAAVNNISLTVPNFEWLKEAEKYLAKENLQLKIHLGIDSGMGRIGFNEDDEFIEANKFLENNDQFFVEGMFAHFASADSADESYFEHQLEKFNHMKSLLTVKP